jgi:hypothetical protein
MPRGFAGIATHFGLSGSFTGLRNGVAIHLPLSIGETIVSILERRRSKKSENRDLLVSLSMAFAALC